MSESHTGSEHVLGSINVQAEITAGVESLKIFFTETRMILAHVSKRGLGSATGVTLLGRLGSGFEGLLRGPSESRRKKKTERGSQGMDPQEILNIDKNNFEISYDEVVQVLLERTPYSVEIMMLTRDDKFRFSTREDSAKVLKLFQEPLTTKIEIRDRDPRKKKLLQNR
ncbi:MAG TPA: hypothetical protein VFV92_06470 [Candidatus Bathyarchaeia archaeon]|nr:hypothetical protein [Candidatus Bathyarchaeia archaeon]